MNQRATDLVITDIDNTVYDWIGFYVPSFLAMVQEIHRISGVELGELKRSFRRVHQKHRTSEYAFAIEELDALRDCDAGLSVQEKLKKYSSAIEAFRSTREQTLKPYPSVRDTLVELKRAGVSVIAHSDSMMGYVSRRLRQLELDTLFSAICAPRDHGVPPGIEPSWVRRFPDEAVHSRVTKLEYAPGVRKPDPAVLARIFESFPMERRKILYVGDSLSRDVLLARRAGIRDVWARYGQPGRSELYEELLGITYWTEADIEEEERLLREVHVVAPSQIIDSFSEVLAIVGINRI